MLLIVDIIRDTMIHLDRMSRTNNQKFLNRADLVMKGFQTNEKERIYRTEGKDSVLYDGGADGLYAAM